MRTTARTQHFCRLHSGLVAVWERFSSSACSVTAAAEMWRIITQSMCQPQNDAAGRCPISSAVPRLCFLDFEIWFYSIHPSKEKQTNLPFTIFFIFKASAQPHVMADGVCLQHSIMKTKKLKSVSGVAFLTEQRPPQLQKRYSVTPGKSSLTRSHHFAFPWWCRNCLTPNPAIFSSGLLASVNIYHFVVKPAVALSPATRLRLLWKNSVSLWKQIRFSRAKG